MTNDEIIEIALMRLYEVKVSILHDILYEHLISNCKDINEFVEVKTRIKEIMFHEGLVTNHGEYSYITHLGKTIFENGGWLKRVERLQKNEKQKEDAIIWESELNRWNVKSRWLPHIFTSFGLVLSIVALSVSLQKSPTEERLLDIIRELQKLQMHDYPTIQPILDSLKSGSLADSLKVDKSTQKK